MDDKDTDSVTEHTISLAFPLTPSYDIPRFEVF